MNFSPVSFRSYFASMLSVLAFLFVVSSCGSDKGKVEGVNMLYGTSSKAWVTDKQTDAAGDKMKQSDADENMEISFTSGGTYAGTQSGKYVFDQAGKTITMTPEGSATSNTFNVETLTDSKLTLVGTSGAKLMLKSK
ncbi:hypothetical protein QMK33_12975 [Hymenobacter sp. H14-R3]|uniref:hypothetical protein n=1 Tax=Hymenobacter sp. H14-R3 TaxID=3046308 RepID=UPI0024B9E72E|nr:hypothetical protein [Hymenobacter sp. H14-R3]MDJ0366070.1 hypothetical protein [Hymenobacter sp. H14-R3]